jgi:hypothetical protein
MIRNQADFYYFDFISLHISLVPLILSININLTTKSSTSYNKNPKVVHI